jgi:hypothetical protein
MKKLLLILLVLAVVGCKKDKEKPIPFQVADYPIELVGEWKLLYASNDCYYKFEQDNQLLIEWWMPAVDSLGHPISDSIEWYTLNGVYGLVDFNVYSLYYINSYQEQMFSSWYLLSLKNDTLHVKRTGSYHDTIYSYEEKYLFNPPLK